MYVKFSLFITKYFHKMPFLIYWVLNGFLDKNKDTSLKCFYNNQMHYMYH